MIKRLLPWLAALALLGSGTATAGVYRWMDDQGQVHYGNLPASSDASRVNPRTFEPATKPEDAASEDPYAFAAQAQAEPDAGLPATRAEKCDLAQQRFTLYSQSDKLIQRNAFGEERTLSAEEQQATIEAARAKVEQYCG